MNSSPDLILAVPGTEQMETMSRREVREALETGEIDPGRLVWSEMDQSWLPLQDVPHLLTKTESLNYRPEPADVEPQIQTAVPVEEFQASAPRMMEASTSLPMKTAQPKQMGRSLSVKETRSFPYLTLVAFLSFLALAGLISANYFFVEMPFQTALKANGWNSDIITHANFGGFYQQDVVIIHLIPSDALTQANLMQSIVSLAKSTPLPPGQTAPFKMVSLTPGWLDSRFLIADSDWAKLATMPGSDEQRKLIIVDHLQNSSGKPTLLSDDHAVDSNKPDFTLDAREQKIWDEFASAFVPAD